MVTTILKDGYPFIFGALAVAAISTYFNLRLLAYLGIFLAGFFAYFFRNPARVIPKQKGILVAPADGIVKRIYSEGKFKEIYIFIRPLDVHINRAPISGTVENIQFKHGKHKMAFKKSATENEENYITIKSGRSRIIIVQVVGAVARRIRCWVNIHDKVKIGQPIGMLLFGSGTRLIMPEKTEILVKEGQVVKAGETIIAKIGKRS